MKVESQIELKDCSMKIVQSSMSGVDAPKLSQSAFSLASSLIALKVGMYLLRLLDVNGMAPSSALLLAGAAYYGLAGL